MVPGEKAVDVVKRVEEFERRCHGVRFLDGRESSGGTIQSVQPSAMSSRQTPGNRCALSVMWGGFLRSRQRSYRRFRPFCSARQSPYSTNRRSTQTWRAIRESRQICFVLFFESPLITGIVVCRMTMEFAENVRSLGRHLTNHGRLAPRFIESCRAPRLASLRSRVR